VPFVFGSVAWQPYVHQIPDGRVPALRGNSPRDPGGPGPGAARQYPKGSRMAGTPTLSRRPASGKQPTQMQFPDRRGAKRGPHLSGTSCTNAFPDAARPRPKIPDGRVPDAVASPGLREAAYTNAVPGRRGAKRGPHLSGTSCTNAFPDAARPRPKIPDGRVPDAVASPGLREAAYTNAVPGRRGAKRGPRLSGTSCTNAFPDAVASPGLRSRMAGTPTLSRRPASGKQPTQMQFPEGGARSAGPAYPGPRARMPFPALSRRPA
jgi:hypothetical protein